MPETSDNNKRIAKNTLMLYLRMLFMVGVSLYTSRIVLHTLGVSDYGINNVVGGVVTMLGFLSSSLSAASSRYITFALGRRGETDFMQRTFGNILCAHFILAAAVVLMGETVGLWFMTTQLHIPSERATAAFWVYQFSVFSFALSIVSVPYNAAVIAHERMSVFAYISIADAVLKLIAVGLLVFMNGDKLILYAAFCLFIQTFDRIAYGIYCTHNFSETRSRLRCDGDTLKGMLSFVVWTMNGNLAVCGFTQGLNILLNIFFGPAVNAARAIAIQVQTVVQQFCDNFQTAFNPQITKSYARSDFPYLHTLLVRASKFSFFILLFISLPLMLEAQSVLFVWLGIVPDHTLNFLRLTIIAGMLQALAGPLIISVHATGCIKKFQIVEGSMLLTIVPISYALLKFFRLPPESVFLVYIAVEILTQCARVWLVLPMIGMNVTLYLREVAKPVIAVALVAPVIPLLVHVFVKGTTIRFFLVCISSVLSVSLVSFFMGSTKGERSFILNRINNFVSKHFR